VGHQAGKSVRHPYLVTMAFIFCFPS